MGTGSGMEGSGMEGSDMKGSGVVVDGLQRMDQTPMSPKRHTDA